MCSKGLLELPDKIPCNDAENSMSSHGGESVEGHDTWNDSHVETLTKKLSFQTSYDAMI